MIRDPGYKILDVDVSNVEGKPRYQIRGTSFAFYSHETLEKWAIETGEYTHIEYTFGPNTIVGAKSIVKKVYGNEAVILFDETLE